MRWPVFKGNVAVCIPEAEEKAMFKYILEHTTHPGDRPDLLEMTDEDLVPLGKFILGTPDYNFFIGPGFLQSGKEVSALGSSFEKCLLHLFRITGIKPMCYGGEPLELIGSFSVSYRTSEGIIFFFKISADSAEAMVKGFSSIRDFLAAYEDGLLGGISDEINRTFALGDRVYYFERTESAWRVVDPLGVIGERQHQKHKKTRVDERLSKPEILICEDDLSKNFIFGNNWILKFDGLHSSMGRPNDVSIYSNICDRNLAEARLLYKRIVLPRYNECQSPFPDREKQKLYIDYFEFITASIIFSFTAIEAMVNTIIPWDFVLSVKDGKAHDKQFVERNYTLTEKLNKILFKLLSTPRPQKEVWWGDFKTLQELRDQTVHTKQSDSEDRYSRLLSKDVFRVIGCYRKIISHYGSYLRMNRPDLLNCFPYGFGADGISVDLVSAETYSKIYKDMHNPFMGGNDGFS
ncbi:hypothetical protein [Pedobacter sp. R-06]|uniref:hypothetical protein n=1 Tax=Pedobacter sp. R-06 TaxID=3404051 RepID=UPI003CF65C73